MRTSLTKFAAALTFVALTAYAPAAAPPAAVVSVGPTLSSIGPLAFGPDGTLYAVDPETATIFALELGAAAAAGSPGTASVPNLDQKIAAMLGTGAGEISIADLAVNPVTHNSYVSVMRGQGNGAKPALLRVDGAGAVAVVPTDALKFSSVKLPNAAANSGRTQVITQLAFSNDRLFVAGLSNEEFASKLWSVPYPFNKADNGTSVEIFHGSHGRLETRSPVYAFVPYTVDNQPYIIGAYLCTPLVKFPVAALKPGAKFRGTTIAELGSGNRPIDMILYKKNGKEFLLMSNTRHGVMKIATDRFATEPGITAPVAGETAGVSFEAINTMTGVVQLGLLDAQHSVVITKAASGLNLTPIVLP
jgi:hypothetical protein